MFSKSIKAILWVLLVLFFLLVCYFFVGFPEEAEKITWGINFSQKQAQNLGLDWKETYLALLDDLGAKELKIATYWDLIEPEQGKYNFGDLDWQIDKAEKRDAKIILVIGMKTGRWPECHLPDWAKNLSKKEQQESILILIENIVLRYTGQSSVWAWQVENEPFFSFGECPWSDKEFLKKEVNLVKSLDSQKPIIISDAGELSFWFKAAKYADMVGTTMYRRVWVSELGFYFQHFYPPTFYLRKANLIKRVFNKETICVELQAEPWGPKLLYDLTLEEQEKSMNLEKFQKNIEFAKKTGFDTFYLWGAEWLYWLKEKQNQPEIWQEAKKLF